MKVALLMTGNELMSGDTVDSNSALIAKNFAEMGFDVDFKATVGDDFDVLANEMRRLASLYPMVLINGGLGPTSDDLTSEIMAHICETALEENSDAKRQISEWCERRKIQLTASNLKQALMPSGSTVLNNPVGSAPGIACRYGDSWLLATPGVPSELRAMLSGSVQQFIKQCFPIAKGRLIRRLKLFGIGESTVQQKVSDSGKDWPQEVVLGFRAGLPLLELKLEIADEAHMVLRDQCESWLCDWFSDSIIGENDDDLPSLVIDLLEKSGGKLALAESCTGGQIAASLTSVPNASRVFDAGIVSYANQAKIDFLGVNADTIATHGVVSEPVVLEMALGALQRIGGTHAIAVSGIAGPSGGSKDKPVGTVCMAWGSRESMRALQFHFPFGRAMFQQYVSAMALDLIRRVLKGNHDLPDFLAPGGRFSQPSSAK